MRFVSFKAYLKVSTEMEKEVYVKICEDLWLLKWVTSILIRKYDRARKL